MAIILKDGKTFNPAISKSYGIDMTNGDYYGVIDIIEYNKKEQMCMFSVNIYASKTARDNDDAVVDRFNFNFTGEAFEQIGNNGLSITSAYTMILAKPELADWQSDE